MTKRGECIEINEVLRLKKRIVIRTCFFKSAQQIHPNGTSGKSIVCPFRLGRNLRFFSHRHRFIFIQPHSPLIRLAGRWKFNRKPSREEGSSLALAALRPEPPSSAGLFEAVTKLSTHCRI
jgi:hypothetical protein